MAALQARPHELLGRGADRALVATGAVESVDFKATTPARSSTSRPIRCSTGASARRCRRPGSRIPRSRRRPTRCWRPTASASRGTRRSIRSRTSRRCRYPPRMVNIKPSRLGGLRNLLEAFDYCAARGIGNYGGGQFELGVGRGQIQYLASLFHADAPNDVAPTRLQRDRAAGGPAGQPAPPARRRGRLPLGAAGAQLSAYPLRNAFPVPARAGLAASTSPESGRIGRPTQLPSRGSVANRISRLRSGARPGPVALTRSCPTRSLAFALAAALALRCSHWPRRAPGGAGSGRHSAARRLADGPAAQRQHRRASPAAERPRPRSPGHRRSYGGDRGRALRAGEQLLHQSHTVSTRGTCC